MDAHRGHVEQIRGMNIEEYADYLLRLHEKNEAAKSRALPPLNNEISFKIVPEVTQNNTERIPTLNTLRCPSEVPIPPENPRVASENDVSDAFFDMLEQTELQGERNDVELEGNIAHQMSTPFTSHMSPTFMPMPMPMPVAVDMNVNNGNQDVLTIESLEARNESHIQQMLVKLRSNFLTASQAHSVSPQSPLINSVTSPSYGEGVVVRGVTTQNDLSDNIQDCGQNGSPVNSKDEGNKLTSCLEAMFYDAGPSSRPDPTTPQAQDVGGAQTPQLQKSVLSPNVSKEKTKSRALKPSEGVSKKSKRTKKNGKKVGVTKKKEFICPYDGCGKAFDRRYNLKVHSRKHTGEMPYTCPKIDEGCFFYFRWRSCLRHHMITVHNEVVPIAQNNARKTSSAVPIVPINSLLPQNAINPASRVDHGASSSDAPRSSKLGVSRRGGVRKAASKKAGRVRKNFPAVAVRTPTAEELARAQMFAALKARDQHQVVVEEAPQAPVELNTQDESACPSLTVNPQPPVTHTFPPCDDVLDVSAFFVSDEKDLNGGNDPSRGTDIDDLFPWLDADIPLDLGLPALWELDDM